jgi:hypothetical protein
LVENLPEIQGSQVVQNHLTLRTEHNEPTLMKEALTGLHGVTGLP